MTWLSMRRFNNQWLKKIHNAYRAVCVSRFQNLLQEGTDTIILILNWGNGDRKRRSAESQVTKIPVAELETELGFQSLVPAPSLMSCAAPE